MLVFLDTFYQITMFQTFGVWMNSQSTIVEEEKFIITQEVVKDRKSIPSNKRRRFYVLPFWIISFALTKMRKLQVC